MALCNRLASVTDVAAIVVSQNISRKNKSVRNRLCGLVNRAAGATVGRELRDAWQKMQALYHQEYQEMPNVPTVAVPNVNDRPVFAAIDQYRPDIVMVSGTNILSSKLIQHFQSGRGILNLHTGISPYVRGGPNCTNWCLAQGWFHLIGSTVMLIDPGIDTGKIITTERAPINGNESLASLHKAVMDHAHSLCARVVLLLSRGQEIPAVPQHQLGKGTTFYTKDWTAAEMRKALLNFRSFYSPTSIASSDFILQAEGRRLISLDDVRISGPAL